MVRALVLALVLLSAQHLALAHGIDDLAAGTSQHEDSKRLCDLHSAMGSVLGALDAAPPAPWLEASVFQGFLAPDRGEALLPPPSPASRGPPDVSLK